MSPKIPLVRIDQELVRRGLADTIEQARGLIMAGKVVVADQRVDKPGVQIKTDARIRVKESSRFVSRAGDKLAGAIDQLTLGDQFKDAVVLDAGASTGGFSQCALSYGAAHVHAVDVGTNQLAWELRNHDQITSYEKTNIKDFIAPEGVNIDWVTADLSFTSTARLVPFLVRLAPKAKFLVLVKPQFELPKDKIPDGGIVESEVHRSEAVAMVIDAFTEAGITDTVKIDSPVEGTKGNREVFVLAQRSS